MGLGPVWLMFGASDQANSAPPSEVRFVIGQHRIQLRIIAREGSAVFANGDVQFGLQTFVQRGTVQLSGRELEDVFLALHHSVLPSNQL